MRSVLYFRLVIAFGLMFLMNPTISFAQGFDDECMIDVETLSPVIDMSSDAIKIIQDAAQGLDQFGVTVKIELPNQVFVEHSIGGCVHYGYLFTFSGVQGLDAKISPQEMIKLVRHNFSQLPLISEKEFGDLKNQINTLDVTDMIGPSYAIDCGDAYCELTIAPEKFTVSYSFPL